MADVTDNASAVEAQFTEMALNQQRAKTQASVTGESAEKCHECGDTIPEARRKAIPHCRHCTSCQRELER
ncbi:TraR/DksA C4-type zinc finger protein [Photobacterium leiognathi subsp. mandapamensis]|uniref:TraR/DksA C4-type zinc finger protein n=1 Tax=Photobacterium leiognathi TaxID=553611 RepID=UPI003AF3DE87